MSIRRSLAWLFVLCLSCSPAMARDESAVYSGAPPAAVPREDGGFLSPEKPDLYPMPLPEAETAVYEFLSRENFEVRREGRQKGSVVLRGEKGAAKWRVVLEPESARATAVTAAFLKDGTPRKEELEKLRNHMMTRVQEVRVEAEDTAAFIPAAVLSRIDTVVCLESVLSDNRTQFSGFIVDQDGLILSTAHDLNGREELNVTLYDGRTAPGRVVKADHHWDLALIEVDMRSASRVSLESGRNLLGVGERIYTVGCPINLRGTVFPGIVNGPPRRVDDRIFWQVSMKIHPGSSGSPVFDSRGALVAVVKGRFRGSESLGFLIPFETVVEFVKEMKRK